MAPVSGVSPSNRLWKCPHWVWLCFQSGCTDTTFSQNKCTSVLTNTDSVYLIRQERLLIHNKCPKCGCKCPYTHKYWCCISTSGLNPGIGTNTLQQYRCIPTFHGEMWHIFQRKSCYNLFSYQLICISINHLHVFTNTRAASHFL